MADNIFLGKEARDKLVDGIIKVAAVIEGSYGAAGGNVIVEEDMRPFFRVTNDGKLSIDKIKLDDPIENIAANIMKEAGDKADKDSGDGRKTTMILLKAILLEARRHEGQPLEISKSLKACIPAIIASIDAQKRPTEIKDVQSVATISSEDEKIGKLIQDIYSQIGKEGIIEVDHSGLPESFFEITEGVRLRGAKCFGQYSYTEKGKAVYKNPCILISKDKITSVDQLEGILTPMVKAGKNELVIYCDDIDMSVASRLAMTHLQGGFKTLIIKAPILWKDWMFEDFSMMTGATSIDSKEGRTFKSFKMEWLGTCDKIVSNDEETRVIGIKDIKGHLDKLNTLGLTDDQQKVRAAWLQTKVATLKVGAQSESELAYLSKKAKDACAASYHALKDGIVEGGGVALLNVAAFDLLSNTLGENIMRSALSAPIEQIMKNFGGNADIGTLKGISQMGFRGINARTGDIVNMFDAGIIDPALVVKNAVKNAISIASTVMTAHGIITLPKQDEKVPDMPRM